jgi:hypothetical protein
MAYKADRPFKDQLNRIATTTKAGTRAIANRGKVMLRTVSSKMPPMWKVILWLHELNGITAGIL